MRVHESYTLSYISHHILPIKVDKISIQDVITSSNRSLKSTAYRSADNELIKF